MSSEKMNGYKKEWSQKRIVAKINHIMTNDLVHLAKKPLSKNQTISLIIVGLILIATPIAFYLVRQEQKLHPRAEAVTVSGAPPGFKITNITGNSFTLSWTSSTAVVGKVQYGKVGEALSGTAVDDRGADIASKVHHVTVGFSQPLESNQTYRYEIVSGQTIFTGPLSTSTGPALSRPTISTQSLVRGRVVKEDGSPAEEALVYMKIKDSARNESNEISTWTNKQGNWVIVLNNARNRDLIQSFSFKPEDTLNLFSQAASEGKGKVSIAIADIQKTLTTIALDKTAPAFASAPPFGGFVDSTKNQTLISDNWYNHLAPFFDWPQASDGKGYGLKGYYIYWGVDPDADSQKDGVFVDSGQTVFSPTLKNDGIYYLFLRTEDEVGNISTQYTAFVYRFDRTQPVLPGRITVDPTGYSEVLGIRARAQESTPTVTVTVTPTETATTTPTTEPSATITEAPTATATVTVAPTESATVTPVPTDSAVSEPTPTPTPVLPSAYLFQWSPPINESGPNDSGVAVYPYSIDSPTPGKEVNENKFLFDDFTGLTQGQHIFRVWAKDKAGNLSKEPARVNFYYDDPNDAKSLPPKPTFKSVTNTTANSVSLNLAKAKVGEEITIEGADLGVDQGISLIRFGDISAPFVVTQSWTNDKIVITIPQILPGKFDLHISAPGGPTITLPFELLYDMFVTKLERLYILGDQATTLAIDGDGFTSESIVKLISTADTSKTFSLTTNLVSPTEIKVAVTPAALPIGEYKVNVTTSAISSTFDKLVLITQTGDIWRDNAKESDEQIRDGKIDINDVSRLLSKWGSTDPADLAEIDINPGPADVSKGKIDLYDANKIMANWTQ